MVPLFVFAEGGRRPVLVSPKARCDETGQQQNRAVSQSGEFADFIESPHESCPSEISVQYAKEECLNKPAASTSMSS